MRKNTKNVDIIIVIVLVLIIAAIVLSVIIKPQEEQSVQQTVSQLTLSDFDGKNIAVQTGTNHDVLTLNKLPNAHISYFNNYIFQIEAVKNGKMDAFVADNAYLDGYIKEDPYITYLNDPIAVSDVGYAFAKNSEGQKLCGQISNYVSTLIQTGKLQEMYEMWFGDDESIKIPFDTKDLDNSNGTIKLAAEFNYAPLIYLKDGKYAGYELYIIYNYCLENSYGLEIFDMAFDGLIPAIQSGLCDIAAAGIEITPEREESVYFSTPHYKIKTVLGIVTGNTENSEITADTDGDGNITYKDYIGKRVGIKTGSSFEEVTFEYLPDSEYVYFDSTSDLIAALEQNKIDAFLEDEPLLRMASAENNGIDYIKQPLVNDDYSFMFPKDSKKTDILCRQFNEMIAELRESGQLKELEEKWVGYDESAKTFDRTPSTGENGTLIVAGMADNEPFGYVSNNEFTGYAVELITLFGQRYGYRLEFELPNAAALIAGVSSGMYDIGIGSISVTEERKENAVFSDTVYNGGVTLAVRASDLAQTSSDKVVPAVTLDELNSPERTIGVGTGASGMLAVEKYLPNAKELMFDSIATAMEAVHTGQADAFVFERRQLQIAVDNGISGVMLLDDNLGEPIDVAVGLSRVTKISGLENSINLFIAEKKADGTLDEMFTRWVVDNNYTMPDITPAVSPEFTLVVGTTGTVEPYSFYRGNELTGYDIEMARRFAAWLGADIEFKVIDYSGIIAAAQSGSIDCIFANLNVTDERKEAIDFSDPIYSIENGIMVAAVSVQETISGPSWTDSIVSSFEKNFIREDRWQLILDGIGTTCFITVLSALFGTVLAFLICMLRRTGSRLANAISNIYVKLLQGTPIVVLLMILYYVIFGKIFSPVWVAIIGFTLNFGAYASEIMRSGIESIDGGQREAALALGYNENQAFFRFIFPQAAVRFLPVYNGEIVSLLKSTSIVGYIAIQDLTKMSDIIRSRTYEAFFPLIATAIIYFILAWIISLILKFILKKVSPKRKRGAAK